MGFLSALLLLAALQGCAGLALKPMCPSLQQCGRQQARQPKCGRRPANFSSIPVLSGLAHNGLTFGRLFAVPGMSSRDSSRDYLTAVVLADILDGTPANCGSPRQGFMRGHFEVTGMPYRMVAKEVPGAGNCLFISLAASLWWNSFGIHPDLQDHAFLDMVHSIRQTAVDTLQDPQVPTLLLEGTEEISRSRLVHLAAYEYNISPRAYCDRMRLPNTWGGGPEIVALSHALGRVIVVYEIDEQAVGSQTTSRQAADHHPLWSYLSGRSVPEPSSTAALNPALKVVACFGFPRNTAHQPLHILFTNSLACSTAGRPGSGQRADHFLPLFPCLV